MARDGVVSSIGRSRESRDPLRKSLARIPIAPPFFLVGTLTGLFATLFQGVHLWLVLHGYAHGTSGYVEMRSGHAALQILGLFGAFISGFLLQAMPRLLETSHLRPIGAMWFFPLFVTGILMVALEPSWSAGYMLFALHFLCLALLVLRFSYLAPRHALYRSGAPLVWGVGWLFIGAIVDLSHPVTAHLVLWGSIVPIAEVAIRRVFFSLAGIESEKNTGASKLATSAYIVSVGLLTYAAVSRTLSNGVWLACSISSVAAILLYIAPRLPSFSPKEFPTRPLALAFWSGIVWLLACAFAVWNGPSGSDAALHLLSTGFALPLVFAVAPHVVRGHTGVQPFPVAILTALLVLWQLVPVGRGLRGIVALPAWFSMVVAVSATFVFAIWTVGVLWALWRSRLGLKPVRAGMGWAR